MRALRTIARGLPARYRHHAGFRCLERWCDRQRGRRALTDDSSTMQQPTLGDAEGMSTRRRLTFLTSHIYKAGQNRRANCWRDCVMLS